MKTFLIFIMALFLPMNDSINETTYSVRATVYNPVKSQCHGNPLKTADGSIIDLAKLERGEIKWIAISQDLRGIFKFGDKVEVISDDPRISGIYEVHDSMPKKWTRKIDILMPPRFNKGTWKVKIRKYHGN